jgi:hypothetical protein
MAEREYRRLTRTRNRSRFALVTTSRSSLWLGRDHLLVIDTSGYTETYKRFHFRDIQALVLCRTDTWLYQAVGLAAFGCLFGLIAIVGGNPVVAWVFGSLAGLFGVFVLIDLLLGPSSKCYIRTAVQTEQLAPLARLRRAQKVFATLRPLITSAQGELPRAVSGGAGEAQAGLPVVEVAGSEPATVSNMQPSTPASQEPA